MSAGLDISSLGEFGLINSLTKNLSVAVGIIGVGDDCAVVPFSNLSKCEKQGSLLVTTDAMVEDVHFRSKLISPEDLGHKLLAISISDVAAMGGVPLVATVCLQTPPNIEAGYLERLYCGLNKLAESERISIVGGDTVRSDVFSLSLTLIGATQHRPVLRSGARVGNELWLSGSVGLSGLGLAIQEKIVPRFEGAENYLCAHQRPPSRRNLGETLGRLGFVSSMIDVSDGLIQDAGHLARSSSVSIEIELEETPFVREPNAPSWGAQQALSSGEDYQLLFTAPAEMHQKLGDLSREFELRRIGRVVKAEANSEISIISAGNERISAMDWLAEENPGYDHFSN